MYTRYTSLCILGIHACLRSDNYCCCFENDPHLSLFLPRDDEQLQKLRSLCPISEGNEPTTGSPRSSLSFFFFSFSPKGIASRPNANKNNTWSDSLTHSVAKEKCISYNTSPWFPFLKVKIKSIFYNWE